MQAQPVDGGVLVVTLVDRGAGARGVELDGQVFVGAPVGAVDVEGQGRGIVDLPRQADGQLGGQHQVGIEVAVREQRLQRGRDVVEIGIAVTRL